MIVYLMLFNFSHSLIPTLYEELKREKEEFPESTTAVMKQSFKVTVCVVLPLVVKLLRIFCCN